MTSATPKSRAGEHVPTSAQLVGSVLSLISEDIRVAAALDIEAAIKLRLEAERDLFRKRERELVEALAELAGDIEGIYDYCKRKDLMVVSIGQFRRRNAARALLSKHRR